MRNPIHIFFYIFFALCLCSCHDGDDAETEDSSSAAIQVAVAFYPGQAGDHGYADGIMESVPQLSKSDDGDKSLHTDVQFFAFDSKRETQMAIRHWASHPENPFLGGNYRRRLLVLTDARQVAWLDGIQDGQQTDELLLLNASKEVVDSLTHLLGNRVHALNISLAREAADMCRYIQNSDNGDAGQYKGVDIFRMAGNSHTADSIDIVCRSMLPADFPVVTGYMAELQTDSVTGEINYVVSQQYARFLAEFYYKYNKDNFLLLDGGSYNLVFDEMSYNADSGKWRTVFLDLNTGTDNYCIRRAYGRALQEWVAEWRRASSSVGMPTITWHGSWDGYVESTIPIAQ